MALEYLTLAGLKELDGGRVAEAFAQAVKRCVSDCEDRPGEERAREVNMSLSMVPTIGDDGKCDGVSGTFQIKEKCPTRKSRTYSFGVKQGGKLFFSTEDPMNVNQFTFDDADETGKAKRRQPVEE